MRQGNPTPNYLDLTNFKNFLTDSQNLDRFEKLTFVVRRHTEPTEIIVGE